MTTNSLPNGALPEVISSHLRKLIEQTGGKNGPIGKQFIYSPVTEEKSRNKLSSDPFEEDKYEIAPGLVYKYKGKLNKKKEIVYYGRALWTISRYCGSYCRFCFRGREVGVAASIKLHGKAALAQRPYLSHEQIEAVFSYIKAHPELNEIIVSGGDPLIAPQPYLTKIIEGLVSLQKDGDLELIRIGTRLPVHSPQMFYQWHYELIKLIKNPFVMLHINHPAELTKETQEVVKNLRHAGATIMSQTVLLKGVNDTVETLQRLFEKLTVEGVRPYYLFQNDPVYWARDFTVPLKRAVFIWKQLRPRLSGLAATVKFTIESAESMGKIPVPEADAWDVDYDYFRDFKGKKFETK